MRIVAFLCIAFCIAGTFADDASDIAKLSKLYETSFG